MRIQTQQKGFTLVEVILAVTIAAGLMVVAISFYQRSAELRTQLLEESGKLTTIRLLMDRMSGDLRTAFAEPRQGFSGDLDHMKFVHAGNPTALNISEGGLKLVTYGIVTDGDATNSVMIGFNRSEEPLLDLRVAATNAVPESFNGGMDPTALTNRVAEPLTRAIHFVQFRYFDGAQWRENWRGVELPMGVEVTFGMEPFPAEEETYPFEVFRRTIYLPAGRASDPDGFLFTSEATTTTTPAEGVAE